MFLAQLRMAASNNLFNKCDQKTRQVKNPVITHRIPDEKLKQLACETAALFCQIVVACCTW